MNNSHSLEKITVATVMVTSFLIAFMGSSLNVALPSMGMDFKSSALMLSWIVSSYILASAAFLLPMGRLADLAGRRKIYLGGTILFTAFTCLCGLAWSGLSMTVFRVLQGIGASMIYATGMALLTTVVPIYRRGRAMGLAVTAVYAGLSVGPVVGGAMCQHLGWRSIFFLTAAGGACMVGLIWLRLKGEWVGARGERFDYGGSVLYMSGLVAVLYGISTISNGPWAKYILVAGCLLMSTFVLLQISTPHPLMNLRLFSHNVTFAFSNLAAMINYSSTFAVSFIVSLYLQVVMGFSPRTTGLILLAQPVVMAVCSSFAGALSDRVEPRIVASWGMGLNAAGLLLFVLLSTTTPVWLIVMNLMLIGLGYALFSSPNTNAIMGSIEERFYGVASSMVSTMRMIGMATSMAIVTLLLTHYVGGGGLDPAHSAELMQTFRMAFIVFGLLCFLGIFASLARGNVRS